MTFEVKDIFLILGKEVKRVVQGMIKNWALGEKKMYFEERP